MVESSERSVRSRTEVGEARTQSDRGGRGAYAVVESSERSVGSHREVREERTQS